MRSKMRVWLSGAGAVVGALVLVFAFKVLRHPSPGAVTYSFVERLDEAVELPKAPAAEILYALEPLPNFGGNHVLGIPFEVESLRLFVVRVRSRSRSPSEMKIELRDLTTEEYRALGSQPFAIMGSRPGSARGKFMVNSESPDGWICFQRFDRLSKERPIGLLVLEGAEAGLGRVEVRDAEMEDQRASQSPVLAPLIRRFPNYTSTGLNWRTSLRAAPDFRYVFDVTLPERAVLRLATGHESGTRAAPVRFIVNQDARVILDETVPPDGQWHDHALPLEGPAGRRSRLTLESQAVPGNGGEPRGLWANPRVVGSTDRPNVLLITVDALRPEHLPSYGCGRDTAPAIAKLAQAGIQFQRATAQAGRTWESVTSLLTGRYPGHSGVRLRGQKVPPDVPLLPDFLREAGYETFAGTDVAFFPPGYLSSFDETEVTPEALVADKAYPLHQMERLVEKLQSQPMFLWFHLEDAHYPLVPRHPLRFDPTYDGRFRDRFTLDDHLTFEAVGSVSDAEQQHIGALYDAAIRDADEAIFDVISVLAAHDLLDRTVIIIAADHGEQLGEHGLVLEHLTPYDAVLHVPLILTWVGHIAQGARVRARVQLIDLVPTILGLAQIPRPSGLDGRDLSAALRTGDVPDAPAYAEVQQAYFVRYRDDEHLIFNPTRTSLRMETGLVVPLPERSLFDLSSDPGELHNLATDQPQRTDGAMRSLQMVMRSWDQSVDQMNPALGQAAYEALMAAGYVHAGTAAVDAGTPPPSPSAP
jgi:arylsulfatase A-like enzyme